jgi:hypothetical protein
MEQAQPDGEGGGGGAGKKGTSLIITKPLLRGKNFLFIVLQRRQCMVPNFM